MKTLKPKNRWDAVSVNDRILVLDQINVVGRVAFQIAQIGWSDLDPDVQKRLADLK